MSDCIVVWLDKEHGVVRLSESGTMMSDDAGVAAQEAVQNLIDRLDKTPKAL